MTRPISIAIGESLQVVNGDLSKFIDLVCSIAVHTMSVSTPNFQVKKQHLHCIVQLYYKIVNY